jgi:manganese transport protein
MSEEKKSHGTSAVTVSPIGELSSSEATKPRRTLWQQLALIGPAFVVGAWQFGPGNLTTAVQAGSTYQYTLIWVIAVSIILMIFLADMSVRIGIKTPVSVISSIKDHLGRPVGALAGIGVFLMTLMFSVGNAVGSGLGLSMLFGGSPVLWTVACSVATGALLFLRNVYRVVEIALVAIVALMAITFVASAALSRPDWGTAASGLIPAVPDGAWVLIIALVGTNFSINAAFFTSYATKQHGHTAADYRDLTLIDTIPGIVAPGIMTALVIIAAATALGRTGEGVNTIAALARVFEPVAGRVGSFMFALGFFGAAFSSMIGNATAGGTMLSDALGRGASSNSLATRIVSGILLTFGAVITVLFQASPVQLIVFAQALTIPIAPILATLIIIMSNHKTLMGDMRNRWWQNVFGVIGLVAVLALSVRLITGFIGG